MGLIFSDRGTDIEALKKVAESALRYFEIHAAANPEFRNLQVGVNDDSIDNLSDVGDLLLARFFPDRDLPFIVATLVVLLNSSFVFNLRFNNRIVSDHKKRRAILSRISCLFIGSALSFFKTESGNRFNFEMTDPQRAATFIMYLSMVDYHQFIKIKIDRAISAKDQEVQERALDSLAKEIMAVALAIQPHIFQVAAADVEYYNAKNFLE